MDREKTSASIKLEQLDRQIYSAQITLQIDNENAAFTVKPANSKAYSTVRTEKQNGKPVVVIYVDSTSVMEGNSAINLATLKANRPFQITGRTAEAILVDRDMRSSTYSDAKVSVSSPTIISSGNTGNGQSVVVTDKNNTSQPAKKHFADVPDSHWAKQSIAYVTEKELFAGMSDTTFEPGTEMTRAMFVTVLNRFGLKVNAKYQIPCSTPMAFSDVASGKWYSDAVAWAGGIGLVNGIGDNRFAPDQAITREQIAVMTVNFAALCGASLPANLEAVEFGDAAEIAKWAVEAVQVMQRSGLIQGKEDGTFDPKRTATRAEVAAILHRFAETVK